MPRESADGDDGEPVARSGVGLSEEIDCCLPCVAGKEGDRAATTPRAPTPPTPCLDREQQLLRAVPPASDQQQCEPKQEPEGPELGRLAAAFYSTPAAAASAAAAAAMTAAAADAAAKERARILANGGTDPVAPNGTLTRSNSSLAQREAHTTAGGTVVSVEVRGCISLLPCGVAGSTHTPLSHSLMTACSCGDWGETDWCTVLHHPLPLPRPNNACVTRCYCCCCCC